MIPPAFALVCFGIDELTAAIDSSSVSVLLPTLARDFQIPLPLAQWIPNAYALALVLFLLAAGWIGDRFGARRVYLIALALYAAATAALGWVDSLPIFLILRFVQGMSNAALFTLSLALMMRTFRSPERAFAGTASFSAAGMVIGPVIGGWGAVHSVGEVAGWRVMFVLCAVLALIALGIATVAVPKDSPRSARSSQDAGGRFITPSREWLFWRGNTVLFLVMVALVGSLYSLSVTLQELRGFSPEVAGYLLMAASLAAVTAAIVSSNGRFARVGILISPVFAAAGTFWFLLSNPFQGAILSFIPGAILLGMSSGFALSTLFTAIMGTAAPRRRGSASGVLNMSQQLGSACGVGIALSLSSSYAGAFTLYLICALIALWTAVPTFVRSEGAQVATC